MLRRRVHRPGPDGRPYRHRVRRDHQRLGGRGQPLAPGPRYRDQRGRHRRPRHQHREGAHRGRRLRGGPAGHLDRAPARMGRRVRRRHLQRRLRPHHAHLRTAPAGPQARRGRPDLRRAVHRQALRQVPQGHSFVKVFTHLCEFENNGSFEGWVRRIIINTAIKINQKKSFSHESIGLEHIKEDSTRPEVFSILSEEELTKLISELPDGYRMVFNLFAIEGFSHKEISEMLNIEESTSRSQLMKARRILQEKVNELYIIAV